MKMKSYLIISLSLALFLAFVSPTIPINHFINKDHLFPEFIKWHIYIVNGLNNSQKLFTHCKSTEDDIGIHHLSPGSNITWTFKTDFFHSTLFWCYVRKEDVNASGGGGGDGGGGDNVSSSFEVFWYDARLFDKCNWKDCIWTAKDDGIYLTDFMVKADELRYRWGDGVQT